MLGIDAVPFSALERELISFKNVAADLSNALFN
jgi:hypothetical protein